MRWCVIRHPNPELGLAVVAEPSLVVHKPLGWQRVSEFTEDQESLHVEDYVDAPAVDDEPEPADTTNTADEQPADTTSSDAGKPAPKTRKATTAGEREN